MWNKLFFICGGKLVAMLLGIYGLEGIRCRHECRSLLKYFKDMYLLSRNHSISRNKEASILLHKFLLDFRELEQGADKARKIPEKVALLRSRLDASVERTFDLDKCCGSLGISKHYLIRLFRNNCGVTPYEYLL